MGRSTFAAACFATLLISAAQALAEPQQSQAEFEKALRDTSTFPLLVRLTVVDDHTSQSRTGCVMGHDLVVAIARETGLTDPAKIIEVALESRDHVFHFAKQSALDAVPIVEMYQWTCAYVGGGQSVRIADRTGAPIFDPPLHLRRAGVPQPIGPQPVQSQADFEQALRNRSTAPSLIRVTVVDDSTGQSVTGCVPAPFLLGAITRESGVKDEAKLLELALAPADHVFHFTKQSALDNLPFDNRIYSDACPYLGGGRTVQLDDYSGRPIFHPPLTFLHSADSRVQAGDAQTAPRP